MGNQQETLGLEFVAGVAVADGCFGIYLRQVRQGYWLCEPRFIVSMKDAETMTVVAETMKAHDLPVYVSQTSKGLMEVKVVGLRRCKKLVDALLPYLTGQKRRAADIVGRYCELRLSKPHKAPLGPDELKLVAEARANNGNYGQSRLPLGLLRD